MAIVKKELICPTIEYLRKNLVITENKLIKSAVGIAAIIAPGYISLNFNLNLGVNLNKNKNPKNKNNKAIIGKINQNAKLYSHESITNPDDSKIKGMPATNIIKTVMKIIIKKTIIAPLILFDQYPP